MASWDFDNDQSCIDKRQKPIKDSEGKDVYKSYTDEDGKTWVYGRRGWRILGDYDG